MHIRCANCGYTDHETRFLDGRKCVFCRGQGLPIPSQPNTQPGSSEQVVSGPIVNEMLRFWSAGLIGGKPPGDASTLNPLTTISETGKQISSIAKVGLVVGGVVVVWFIYQQVRLAQRVVPEAIKVAPHLLPFLL